ncbi:MAG: flagellar type III secretion system protein FliQ [Candidatus Marinimicrobia bacterium]|nr:flagellar type III secretion system protein FliQ [Candidatus Neomarinimicrobiota bacterium]
MNVDYVIFITKETLKTAMLLLTPVLGAGLVVGIIVSLFQTVTSIREMTLSLIPKMAVVALVIMLLIPWFLDVLMTFTIEIFKQIPLMVK